MAANTSNVVTLPRVVEAQGSITRLANATQYAAGDALSDHATTPTSGGYFTLALASRAGGGGLIFEATLHKSDQDQTTADFAVLLFDTLPAVAGFKDNLAVAITDAEMKNCKGVIRFKASDWQNVGLGDIQTVSANVGFVAASSSVTLYGIVAVQDTYTPASGEVFTLTVKAYQD